jgi:mono/diheme cytochrome c family protein
MATDTPHTPHTHDTNGNGNGALANGELYGVLAEYDTPGELIEAAKKVRDAGFTDFDCYSPFPVHGIDPAMGIKRTILPLLIFGGGFTGAIGGLALQWYCNAHAWTWNISGKPTWSIPANIPIAYECAILLAVFVSFFGMWIANKLPQVWHPLFRSDKFTRATDDGFFLGIEAKDRRFDAEKTPKLLADAGALSVEHVYLDPDPVSRTMPKWIAAFIVSSTAFALIPFAVAAKARNSHSSEPHIHIFPDMDFQPKYKSDTAMDMFPDGRENRGEIAGTVPRGWLEEDDLFYRGLEGGDWAKGFPRAYPDGRPFVVDEALLHRGQDRFNIYCTPCHGYDGRGDGMIPERVKASGGAWQARNLVEAPQANGAGGVVVQLPNGQVFNTISNGYNTMLGYAAQIPHADRWAIVAYVRALERAQNASADDVPATQRGSIR